MRYRAPETAIAEIEQADQVSILQLQGVEINGRGVKPESAIGDEGWIHAEENEAILVECREFEINALKSVGERSSDRQFDV